MAERRHRLIARFAGAVALSASIACAAERDDVADAAARDSEAGLGGTVRTTSIDRVAQVAIDPISGMSAPISFEIAADTQAFALTATTSSDVLLALVDLRPAERSGDPSDAGWPDDPTNSDRTCWTCAWPSHLDRRSATLVSERGAGTEALTGTWTVRVIARSPARDGAAFAMPDGPVSTELWLGQVRSDDPTSGLAMDLAVWAQPSLDVDAVVDWVLGVDVALRSAGITVGNIDVRHADGSVDVVIDRAGGMNGLPPDVLEARFSDAIRVVLTDTLVDAEGQRVLGFSGGLPGPIQATDDPTGVVAINLPFALSLGVEPGHLLAHELGHQLGLQHTIERGAALGVVGQDRLDDTEASDSSNLMFWEARVGGTSLSPSQVRVLRAHPRLRAAPR